jgi:hypothetical protein
MAYSDVKKAFEIYLKKYNNGRPIIIASRRQGPARTKFLLGDFFDDKPLRQKLIAVYVAGTVMKPNLFKTIKPMIKPNEIGVFWVGIFLKKGVIQIKKIYLKAV